MNLNPIKANMTELQVNNMLILFSYQTPVAMIGSMDKAYKTSYKWSQTTIRHINKWLSNFDNPNIEIKPQSFFDNLVKEVKI